MAPEKLRKLRGWDISYIFQDPLSAMDPVRTVGDQVSQVLRLRGVGRLEANERTIEMLSGWESVTQKPVSVITRTSFLGECASAR